MIWAWEHESAVDDGTATLRLAKPYHTFFFFGRKAHSVPERGLFVSVRAYQGQSADSSTFRSDRQQDPLGYWWRSDFLRDEGLDHVGHR